VSDSGDVRWQSTIAFRLFGGGVLAERGSERGSERGGMRSLRGCRETVEAALWLGVGEAEHSGWLDYLCERRKKNANNAELRGERLQGDLRSRILPFNLIR